MLWVVGFASILIILPANAQDAGSLRLPNEVRPERYSLTVEPDFNTFNFTGTVEIDIQVINRTSSITLHSVGHTLQNLTIKCSSSSESYTNLAISSTTVNSTAQFLVLGLSQNVTSGSECTLRIQYEAALGQENHGFYRAQYTDKEGIVRWFATTEFQPTYAREAFPCFDEPALKAEFQITIIRPNNYNALSNTAKNTSMDYSDTKQMDIFLITPKMSTYLVAFIVSEFTGISSGYQGVYGEPDLIDEGRADLALSMGLQILPTIENFVGLTYNSSLSKLDNVGIPKGYYIYGGMENWGLVTYLETNIFSKENVSTSLENQTVVTIMSHEYGHSWFGNLVSPQWWNYFWINEGFATYFEYYGASTALASWRLMERFGLAVLQDVLATDQLQSTRIMTYDVETPSEIAALIDDITYKKSASVIRMAEQHLTTAVFRKGLNKFLVNNSYSAVTEYELWSALDEAAEESGITLDVTMEKMMLTWTRQPGFPLVTFEVDSTSRVVSVTQERFIIDNSSYVSNETWIIPISYTVSSSLCFTDTSTKLLLTANTQTVSPFASTSTDEWIMANIQTTGYYRVNYDEQNWKLIINYLNSDSYTNIHPSNRAKLLDDALYLARVGKVGYDMAFDLLNYLSRETDYVPLYSYYDIVTFLNRGLSASPNITLFREWSQNLLQAAFENLTFTEFASDDHVRRLNRHQVLFTLCNINDETVWKQANALLRTWQHISPDLQATVYCGGMKNGGEEEWTYLYNLYISNTTESLEVTRIVNGLTCTENTTLLQRVLAMALNQSTQWSFRSADRLTALTYFFRNSDNAIDLVLKTSFSLFYNSFSTSDVYSILDRLSVQLTRSDRQATFKQILQLEDSTNWSLYGDAYNNSLNNIVLLNDWINNYQDTINNWLIENAAATTT